MSDASNLRIQRKTRGALTLALFGAVSTVSACASEPVQAPIAVNDPCRLSNGEARHVELVASSSDQLAYPEVAEAIVNALRELGSTYPDLEGFPAPGEDMWAVHHTSHAPRAYMVDPKSPRFEVDLQFSLFIPNAPEPKHDWDYWIGDLRVVANTKGNSAASDALNDVLECACKTMNRVRGEGSCGPEPEQRVRRQSIICNPVPDKEPEPEKPVEASAPEPPKPAPDPNRVLDIDDDIDELRTRTAGGKPEAASKPMNEPTVEALRARAGEVKPAAAEADDATKNACMLTWWLETGHHAGY